MAGAPGVHDPGKIFTGLVVTLALGGDCLADVAVLRAQPELAGPRANAIAGRWIGSARRERLDRMLIAGGRYPRLVPAEDSP